MFEREVGEGIWEGVEGHKITLSPKYRSGTDLYQLVSSNFDFQKYKIFRTEHSLIYRKLQFFLCTNLTSKGWMSNTPESL